PRYQQRVPGQPAASSPGRSRGHQRPQSNSSPGPPPGRDGRGHVSSGTQRSAPGKDQPTRSPCGGAQDAGGRTGPAAKCDCKRSGRQPSRSRQTAGSGGGRKSLGAAASRTMGRVTVAEISRTQGSFGKIDPGSAPGGPAFARSFAAAAYQFHAGQDRPCARGQGV